VIRAQFEAPPITSVVDKRTELSNPEQLKAHKRDAV